MFHEINATRNHTRINFVSYWLLILEFSPISGSEMTIRSEIEHHLWLDAICQNQNLGKNLLAEETLLADQRQCQYGWVNDINTPTTSSIPVYEVRLFELAVIGAILWKTTLRERYQHQQPAHVKLDCSS